MTEKDYKILLKNKLIEYRNSLNLTSDLTFGVEIEYENIPIETFTNLLNEEKKLNPNIKKWISKRELDLEEYNNKIKEWMNGEVTSPILTDNKENWNNLKIILDLLNKSDAIITNKCGGHVNIGAHILGNNQEYWRNFLLLWLLYYDEICKFSSGEFINLRKRRTDVLNKSNTILNINTNYISKINDNIYDYLTQACYQFFSKKYDLSLEHFIYPYLEENNRIEFRLPNATLNETIWQNYINFFAKFVLACKKELDIEKTLYKIKNKESSAIELANYIFDSDIDKEYFIIQTLKTNKIYKKELLEHKIYY